MLFLEESFENSRYCINSAILMHLPDQEERDQIEDAMDVYSAETCLKFSLRRDEKAYIQFQRGSNG